MILLLVSLLAPALAEDPSLPYRPTTFVVDDTLTTGAVENFRTLAGDPTALAGTLTPKAAPPAADGTVTRTFGKHSLPVQNRSSSYADISVNGVKVGRIGPLTVGAIHGVKPGVYTVAFRLQDGSVEEREVKALPIDKPLVPGSAAAKASLDEGWVPTWSANPAIGIHPEAPPPPAPKPLAAPRRVVRTADMLVITDKVNFETGSANLLPESTEILDHVASVLAENGDIQLVEVGGHTDDVGADADNLALSQKRAEAVMAYLVGKGIAADRLQAKGYGETRPLSAETPDEARDKSRRVEFKLLRQAPKTPSEAPTPPSEGG